MLITDGAPTETGPAPLALLFLLLSPFAAAGLVVGVRSKRHASSARPRELEFREVGSKIREVGNRTLVLIENAHSR
jgi:hypothetical protein